MFCFAKCCCLCLSKNTTLTNYLCQDVDNITYYDKLKHVMPTLFYNNSTENIPKLICQVCREKLHKMFQFVQTCFKSRKLFHEYYCQMKLVNNNDDQRYKNYVLEVQLTDVLKSLKKVRKPGRKPKQSVKTNRKLKIKEVILKPETSNFFGEQIHIENIENNFTETVDVINSEPIEQQQEEEEEEIVSDFEFTSFNLSDDSDEDIKEPIFECTKCGKTFYHLETFETHQNIYHMNGQDDEQSCTSAASSSEPEIKWEWTFDNHENIDDPIEQSPIEEKYVVKDAAATTSDSLFINEIILNDELPEEEETNKIDEGNEEEQESSNELKDKTKIKQEPESSHSNLLICPVCKQVLHNQKNFFRHLNMKHSNRKRIYKCDVCGKELAARSSLWQHKRSVHLGIKLYKCGICRKRYVKLESLRTHLQTHIGDNKNAVYVIDDYVAQII